MVTRDRRGITLGLLFLFLACGCAEHQFLTRVSSGDDGLHHLRTPSGMVERFPTEGSMPEAVQQPESGAKKKVAVNREALCEARHSYSIPLYKDPGERAWGIVGAIFMSMLEVGNVALTVVTYGQTAQLHPQVIESIIDLASPTKGERSVKRRATLHQWNHPVKLQSGDLSNPRVEGMQPGDVVAFYRVPEQRTVYGPVESSVATFDLWIDKGVYEQMRSHLASSSGLGLESFTQRFFVPRNFIYRFPTRQEVIVEQGENQVLQEGAGKGISREEGFTTTQSPRDYIKTRSHALFPVELYKRVSTRMAKSGDEIEYHLALRRTFIRDMSEYVIVDMLPRGVHFREWSHMPSYVTPNVRTKDEREMLILYGTDLPDEKDEPVEVSYTAVVGDAEEQFVPPPQERTTCPPAASGEQASEGAAGGTAEGEPQKPQEQPPSEQPPSEQPPSEQPPSEQPTGDEAAAPDAGAGAPSEQGSEHWYDQDVPEPPDAPDEGPDGTPSERPGDAGVEGAQPPPDAGVEGAQPPPDAGVEGSEPPSLDAGTEGSKPPRDAGVQ